MTTTMTAPAVESPLPPPEPPRTAVELALNVPFSPVAASGVRRFGFEYEMLSHDDSPERYDDEPNDGDYDYAREEAADNHQCACDDCIYDRAYSLMESRNAEYGSSGTSLANELHEFARRFRPDLVSTANIHEYHCHCHDCAPNRSHGLMAAQTDCTVGIEFVSRICDVTNPDDLARIDEWVAMMTAWAAGGNWMPDGNESCGNHVHISKNGDDTYPFSNDERQLAWGHINALYAVFDWTDVADGGCGRIRDYNYKPSATGNGGNWLSDRGYGTFEHRVWNTPSDPQRLFAHIGISIALTRWAFGLALAAPSINFWTGTNRYGERSIANDVIEAFNANRDAVVEAVSAYIPSDPMFDVARTTLTNLATY